MKVFLWVIHFKFCWVSSQSHELSFCLFMRHSIVNLWTRCQFLCLDLCCWPWLHTYSGMSADSLSAWVNIPPDCCLFAQIRGTDPKRAHFSPLSPAFTSKLITLLKWAELCLSSDDTRLDYCMCRIQRVSAPFKRHSTSYLSCTQTWSSQSSLHMVLQEYKGLFADVW